jgi:predicted signal transduction protein with EAL and GGDEF domain
LQHTIKRADKALYRAKQLGKNQAVIATSDLPESSVDNSKSSQNLIL